MNTDHPQLAEAIGLLRDELSFAIVEPKHAFIGEVRARANETFECRVESTSKDEPGQKDAIEARGFMIERVIERIHFGPNTGNERTLFRVSRGQMDVKTAAREAIELFLLIWGLARNDRLSIKYDGSDD